MKTKIVKIDDKNIDSSALLPLGKIIREGGLVAFPTETVYGLGADALNEEAVGKIFSAKNRPADNPLIVHFCDIEDIEEVAYITDDARRVLNEFSPGPLTVILKKKAAVSTTVTAGLDSVAVRIPSSKTARAFIKAAGRPIAAPSANLSGKPSPTNFRDVFDDMSGRIDAIIDGADCSVGVESTVLDMTGDKPVILRPGGVTLNDIRKVLPNAEVDKHVLQSVSKDETPKCPGMKYKHYAPDAEVYVVEGDIKNTDKKIQDLIAENSDKKIGVFSMGEEFSADFIIYAGKDNKEYARNLFAALREFDRKGMEIVYAQFTSDDDYGLAVRNRLYKSAANRVIRV